jgi:hypothetical protein
MAARLENKLLQEMKPGALFVAYLYRPGLGLFDRLERVDFFGQDEFPEVEVYRMPAGGALPAAKDKGVPLERFGGSREQRAAEDRQGRVKEELTRSSQAWV